MTDPRIAIIADAHFHDTTVPFGSGGSSVRRLAETARAIRVLNESAAALRFALDDIEARGIRLVVLLGDFADDGQAPTLAALNRLLDGYRAHGLRFLAVLGNHDAHGPTGRHRTRRFLLPGGGYRVVTSDPAHRDPGAQRIEVDAAMACLGVPAALRALPRLGFFRDPDDLHWETPFGAEDALSARTYGAPGLVDSSYLIEPAPGLWLLMIDANVYVPGPGGPADPTAAGWADMARHKGFVLDWMADVAGRAARQGKRLLCFSHYPMLGPLEATAEAERQLLGLHGLVARVPPPEAARRLIGTGVRLHFSGHLHVNETNRLRHGDGALVNVSLPSLVAWPAAYKIVTPGPDRVQIETVEIGAMPLPEGIRRAYRAEAAATGLSAAALLAAPSYGAFLWDHLGHLVGRRFLRRDWPADLAQAARSMILPSGPVLDLLQDWYRLRMGGDLTRRVLPPSRLLALGEAATLAGELSAGEERTADVLRLLGRGATQGLPSGTFTVDLNTAELRGSTP